MPDWGTVLFTVAFCFLIVFIGVYFATKKLSWLIKNRVRLISLVVILGIVVYAIGHLFSKDTQYSVADCIIAGLLSIFSVGRMFAMESDIGEFYQQALTPLYRGVFGAVMTLSILVLVTVGLSLFGLSFFSGVRVLALRLFGCRNTLYVFTGLSDSALSLARNIRVKKRHAVILFMDTPKEEEPADRHLIQAAAAEGFFLLQSSQSEQKKRSLKEFGIFPSLHKTNVHFIALQHDVAVNTSTALTLAALLQLCPFRERVTLHVLTDECMFADVFDRGEFRGIDFVLLDQNALASYDLTKRVSLVRYVRANMLDGRAQGTCTVMVVGSSAATPHLYRDLVTQGQFLGLELCMLAVDEKISDKAAPFLAENPQFDRCVQLEWIDLAPNTEPFFAFCRQRLCDVDVVICAGENDQQNAQLSKTLKKMSSEDSPRLFCALIRTPRRAELLFSGELYKSIVTFGADDLIERNDVVINETMDLMAKAVHHYYCMQYTNSLPWRQLSTYERQSSRALALHIDAKLMSVNMQLVLGRGSDAYAKLLDARPDILENLAKGEHMRWNAFLFSHGWTQLTLGEPYQPADKIHKLHPCLTDWEELAQVSKAAGRNFEQMDRHLIANLHRIAEYAGMQIVPIPNRGEPINH